MYKHHSHKKKCIKMHKIFILLFKLFLISTKSFSVRLKQYLFSFENTKFGCF